MAKHYFDFSANRFLGVFALEHILPRRQRLKISRVLNLLIVAAVLILILREGGKAAVSLATKADMFLPAGFNPASFSFLFPLPAKEVFAGVIFIILGLRIGVFLLDVFYHSKTSAKSGEPSSANFAESFNFYAAELWYEGIFLGAGESVFSLREAIPRVLAGKLALLRLGVFPEEFKISPEKSADAKNVSAEKFISFLAEKKQRHGGVSLADLWRAILETDKELSDFFAVRNLNLQTVCGAVSWMEKSLEAEDSERRWWTREKLGRLRGFAKDWAYGASYLLENYASDLGPEAEAAAPRLVGKERQIKLLEGALLKRSGANVILAGEPGAGKRTVLFGLARMISSGEIFPELEHRRVFLLNGPAIIASGKTKGETEKILLNLLNEAVRVGNVILAVEDFPEFADSLERLGVSVSEIFSPYLSGREIHIIALASSAGFRKILENNAALMKHFEKVDITEPGPLELLEILQEAAPRYEAVFGGKSFLTYPALLKISEGATQYLVAGALPKRAIDLMQEVLREGAGSGMRLVAERTVEEIISRKINIPLGEIKEEEQKKLLNLEELIHRRVIDQEEAISAVANVIRRARAGTRNPQKPIGSFLFLGPTGVGKTETAKALAAVYFKNEEAMIRLDMSEYQNEDSLERLTGYPEKDEPGILASKMRASPYAVLLLDEFEKSHPKIRNLFLQILDEGFFSDYEGRRINMRNAVIIATSNAGSQLIEKLVEQNVSQAELTEEVIAYVQREGIINPELLNRFDAAVIFRPLDRESLKKICKLALEKLAFRLKNQHNIYLKIDEQLIDAVARGGFDSVFGARRLNRFIQDKVEKAIAEKIIRGEIKPGGELAVSAEEMR